MTNWPGLTEATSLPTAVWMIASGGFMILGSSRSSKRPRPLRALKGYSSGLQQRAMAMTNCPQP